MVIKNNNNVYMTSQKSATISYLIWSLIIIAMTIAMEVVLVQNFFKSPLNEAIGIAVIIHIAYIPFVALLTYSYLPAYKRRTNFPLYFMYIEDADMALLKRNYHICYVDQTGVLFIENTPLIRQAYRDWTLMHRVSNLREVKELLFREPATTSNT